MKKIVLLAAALLLAAASFAQSEYNYQKRSLFEQLQDLFKGFGRKGCRIFVIEYFFAL